MYQVSSKALKYIIDLSEEVVFKRNIKEDSEKIDNYLYKPSSLKLSYFKKVYT